MLQRNRRFCGTKNFIGTKKIRIPMSVIHYNHNKTSSPNSNIAVSMPFFYFKISLLNNSVIISPIFLSSCKQLKLLTQFWRICVLKVVNQAKGNKTIFLVVGQLIAGKLTVPISS